MENRKLVLDANGALVGRLSAKVAKALLTGHTVTVVNAEAAVFSGSTDFIVNRYYKKRQMTDKANPAHGAKWPRRPDMFLRRVIRGMLPHRAFREKDSLSRLRVYLGTPADVTGAETMAPKFPPHHLVSVAKVCQRLGWNGA